MFLEKLLLGRQWRRRQSRYWWRDPRPGYNLQGRTPGPWLYNLHAGCWLLLATHWPSSLQLCARCDGAAPGLTPGAWCLVPRHRCIEVSARENYIWIFGVKRRASFGILFLHPVEDLFASSIFHTNTISLRFIRIDQNQMFHKHNIS